MSIKVLSVVWEQSNQEGSALLMMLAIADYCDDDGVCWPSVPTLAKKARIEDRAAQVLLRKLEVARELEISYRAGVVKTAGGIQRTNRYRVLLQGGARNHTTSAAHETQGSAATGQGGAKSGQGGAVATAPNPSLEPSVEPKEKDMASPEETNLTTEEWIAQIRAGLDGQGVVRDVPRVSGAEVARERRLVDGPSRHLAEGGRGP